MFRENESDCQQSFFDAERWLARSQREQMRNSWASTYRRKVHNQINEERFAVLYSDEPSRPNAPINHLVDFEILKSGFGWSDAEAHEQVSFNLLVRHAMGLDDVRTSPFTLRTVYNFRRRVREHAERTGENLMQRVFEDVTDAQLADVAIETGWQRMDSTQVLSNLANLSRLELIVGVAQQAYAALEPDTQAQWAEKMAPYVDGRPQQVCYRIQDGDVPTHLAQLGAWLVKWEAVLAVTAPQSDALVKVRRVLAEQYRCEADGAVTVRPAGEIAADSLQSPHDPDATYREKGGKSYPGGYVADVSETVDPENKVQLITDLQVEQNVTDDSQMMGESLTEQAARGIDVAEVTTDGGYTGPKGEAACEQHEVTLRPTRLRGGRSNPDHWGWEKYQWKVDEEGHPTQVTCPQGQTVPVTPGRTDGRYLARFDRQVCAACPHFQHCCRVEPRERLPPTLCVDQRTVEVARNRQRLRPKDRSVRAAVEATVRSLKHAFPGGKLPVRGLIRARMVLYGAAVRVNMRRLHRFRLAEAPEPEQNGVFVVQHLVFAIKNAIHRFWTNFGLFSRFCVNYGSV